jgi:hypothetical protein
MTLRAYNFSTRVNKVNNTMNTQPTTLPRTNAFGMKIRSARTGVLGIRKTFTKIQKDGDSFYKEALDKLSQEAENFKFREWIQGSKVHVFVTKDGRVYRVRALTVRPTGEKSRHVGLELYQAVKDPVNDFSHRVVIMQILTSADIKLGISLLKNLSEFRVEEGLSFSTTFAE